MAKKPDPSPPDSLSFEQALEEVESITARIETGEIGLERSLAEYERGVALIRRCKGILAQAEQRVEHLHRLDAKPDAEHDSKSKDGRAG